MSRRAERFVVYQCRPQEDCGGWGDRLAGIMGATFLALSTQAALKINFPGLDRVFRAGTVNWAYDTRALNLSAADERLLEHRFVTGSVAQQFPDPAFGGLSGDAAVLNTLNSWSFTYPGNIGDYQRFRILFFHGNRGFTREWYERLASELGWRELPGGWMGAYRCIFQALFIARGAFLDSRVPLLSGARPRLRDMASALSSRGTRSVALHFRNEDISTTSTRLDAVVAADLQCARNATAVGGKQGRSVAFFASNSLATNHQAQSFLDRGDLFDEVWAQKLTGEIHISAKDGSWADSRGNLAEKAASSLWTALQDWWPLTLADTLVFGYPYQSGFSMSAGLVASSQQHRVGAEWCKPLGVLEDLCASRFC